MRKRYWLLGLGAFVVGYIAREIYRAEHQILSIQCTEDYSSGGVLYMVESPNIPTISNRGKLRQLLNAAEYQQALDTSRYYAEGARRYLTYRPKNYVEYEDSVIVAARYTAKLVLVYDNTLGSGRQYFFQIRTYTKDNYLIDKADFATWSETKKEFCSGWLTDDHFLIRGCSRGEDEIKRINQSGHFIIPSQRTVTWLKIRGY